MARHASLSRLLGVAVLVVAIGVVVVWLKVVRGSEDPAAVMATFVAKRGPLTISVLESGAIKAKEQEVIRNEVEGRTTIISIVPEGTPVKKGDAAGRAGRQHDERRADRPGNPREERRGGSINAQETLTITESQGQERRWTRPS